jgi:hypothetical protein
MLSENLVNRLIFPDHVLTASETEAGLDVANLGTGRRQRELSRWSSVSLNTEAWVQVAMDRVRVFNFIFIDRGHNLDDKQASVRVSSDSFTTYTEVGPYTIPSQVFPYGRLADGRPLRTEEGAIVWALGEHGGKQVRLNIPAMGAGLKPELVNLMIGMWFSPEHAMIKPFDFGMTELTYKEIVSPQAQAGAGEIGSRIVGEVGLKLADRNEYALARYHLEQLAFKKRRPMVLIHDDEEAEKTQMVYVPPGRHGFQILPGEWSEFQGRFPYHENEPVIQ